MVNLRASYVLFDDNTHNFLVPLIVPKDVQASSIEGRVFIPANNFKKKSLDISGPYLSKHRYTALHVTKLECVSRTSQEQPVLLLLRQTFRCPEFLGEYPETFTLLQHAGTRAHCSSIRRATAWAVLYVKSPPLL